MGLDAEIYVRTILTPERVAEIIDEVDPDFLFRWKGHGGVTKLAEKPYADEEIPSAILHASTVERYYNRGYERGRWPRIGMVLRALLNHPEIDGVWYLPDVDPWRPWELPWCRSNCDDLDRHYGKVGRAYHREREVAAAKSRGERDG